MFTIGDLVIYSGHGICRIDDICDQTYSGIERTYYIMHPIEDEGLTIQTPTDNEQALILKMMNQKEAKEVLLIFAKPGVEWIEKNHDRTRTYSDIVKSGDRKEIAKIVTTLIRRKTETENKGKKLGETDRRMLFSIQHILFKELAYSLNTSSELMEQKIYEIIGKN